MLGMYCTDPFETLYCKGIDLKRLVRAGVDYLMPNIVPTGLRLQHPDRPDRFHRYMTLAPLTSACVPEGKLLSLLGVKDATEEWDVLHHAPCLLERDIYTLLGYQTQTGSGLRRSLTGLMVCLGDGIRGGEWKWLRERLEIGFVEGVRQVLAPTLVWSDAALYNTLPAYSRTRRWTLHRFYYEMAERGTLCGAILRSENLAAAEGCLFVPNFDLLSEAEKRAVAAYRKGPVVGTAAVEGFTPADYGIAPDLYFEDRFSSYPLCAFAFNATLDNREAILALTAVDDGTPNLGGDPADAPEHSNVLAETLTFSKVTTGFRGPTPIAEDSGRPVLLQPADPAHAHGRRTLPAIHHQPGDEQLRLRECDGRNPDPGCGQRQQIPRAARQVHGRGERGCRLHGQGLHRDPTDLGRRSRREE